MLLREFYELNEASYPGNLGMMEMFKFYEKASNEQKRLMKELISKKLFDGAWELLQQVTGVKLHSSVKEALTEQLTHGAEFVMVMGGAGSGKNHFIEHDPKLATFELVDVDAVKQDMGLSTAVKWIKPRLEELFKSRQNVVHPTTGSNLIGQKNKLALAAAYGYTTTLILINTDPKHAVKNVAKRREAGGHDVNVDDIIRSNMAAKENFNVLKSQVDNHHIINNTI